MRNGRDAQTHRPAVRMRRQLLAQQQIARANAWPRPETTDAADAAQQQRRLLRHQAAISPACASALRRATTVRPFDRRLLSTFAIVRATRRAAVGCAANGSNSLRAR